MGPLVSLGYAQSSPFSISNRVVQGLRCFGVHEQRCLVKSKRVTGFRKGLVTCSYTNSGFLKILYVTQHLLLNKITMILHSAKDHCFVLAWWQRGTLCMNMGHGRMLISDDTGWTSTQHIYIHIYNWKLQPTIHLLLYHVDSTCTEHNSVEDLAPEDWSDSFNAGHIRYRRELAEVRHLIPTWWTWTTFSLRLMKWNESLNLHSSFKSHTACDQWLNWLKWQGGLGLCG